MYKDVANGSAAGLNGLDEYSIVYPDVHLP